MPEVPPEYGSIRRSRVTLRAGPYFIEGTIPTLPSSDPIASPRRRARIELTRAVIVYRVAGLPRRDLVPGLSVNRYQVESMAEADQIDPWDGWRRRDGSVVWPLLAALPPNRIGAP
jgi:hypothetical protein